MHYIGPIIVLLGRPIRSEIPTVLLLGLVNHLVVWDGKFIVEAIAMRLLVCCCVLIVMDWHLLRMLLWNKLIRLLILAIGADVHVIIHILLIIFWESFLGRHMVIFLWVVFKECLGSRWLGLVMARITTVLIALEILLAHVLTLLQSLLVNLDSGSHDTSLPVMHRVLLVVNSISIWYILGMDAAASLDHGQLLCVQILVWIRCEATHWLFGNLLSFILAASSGQVRQLLLGFAELVVVLFLVWKDAFDLIRGPHIHFCAMAAHVIGVFTILRKCVSKISPHAGLGMGSGVLLFQHEFLLSKFPKPRMLQGLTCCDSVIRIINQQFCYQVLNFWACFGNQLHEASSFHCWEIKLHMGRVFLEIVEQIQRWWAKDVMDSVDLVNFIIAWK